jgi:hypothetical protein
VGVLGGCGHVPLHGEKSHGSLEGLYLGDKLSHLLLAHLGMSQGRLSHIVASLSSQALALLAPEKFQHRDDPATREHQVRSSKKPLHHVGTKGCTTWRLDPKSRGRRVTLAFRCNQLPGGQGAAEEQSCENNSNG